MMITQKIPGCDDNIDEQDEYQLVVDNDFIGKNKNMLAFYREHDHEKRQAFSKLNHYFSTKAKYNRQAFLEDKRNKAIENLKKWDKYRVLREQVITILVKHKREQHACRTWLILQAFHSRLNVIEERLKEQREILAAKAREEARKRKLAEEAANAEMNEPDKQEDPEATAELTEARGEDATAEINTHKQSPEISNQNEPPLTTQPSAMVSSAKSSANGDHQQEQATTSNRPNSSEDVTVALKAKESSQLVKAGDEMIKVTNMDAKEDDQTVTSGDQGGE